MSSLPSGVLRVQHCSSDDDLEIEILDTAEVVAAELKAVQLELRKKNQCVDNLKTTSGRARARLRNPHRVGGPAALSTYSLLL